MEHSGPSQGPLQISTSKTMMIHRVDRPTAFGVLTARAFFGSGHVDSVVARLGSSVSVPRCVGGSFSNLEGKQPCYRFVNADKWWFRTWGRFVWPIEARATS